MEKFPTSAIAPVYGGSLVMNVGGAKKDVEMLFCNKLGRFRTIKECSDVKPKKAFIQRKKRPR